MVCLAYDKFVGIMREVDYLIVGQGIAGTLLAYQLTKKGKSFMVIDRGFKDSASFVAAGVINPIVLKRITLSWKAKEFLSYSEDFYPDLDKFLKTKSYHPLSLHKLISSKDEESFWKKRWEKLGYDGLAEPELRKLDLEHLSKDFKIGSLKNTAWVDLKLLLQSFREYLLKENLLIEENLEYLDLECHQYRDKISFDKVVFCEGNSCRSNPYFNHLPFSPNKGELITIKSSTLELQEIYKKKVFVIPLGNHLYRVGATYERRFKEAYDAEAKKKWLLESFEEIFNCDYEVVDQESGVRPAVKDRRPLVGKHPLINNFYLFNGLGSRGCLMAPLLSEQLVNHIEEGNELFAEVDLDR